MSDIMGNGYGSSHDWRDLGTSASRATLYKCVACGRSFAHHYPSTPNIFEAIAKARFIDAPPIPDKCAAVELAP